MGHYISQINIGKINFPRLKLHMVFVNNCHYGSATLSSENNCVETGHKVCKFPIVLHCNTNPNNMLPTQTMQYTLTYIISQCAYLKEHLGFM